MPRRTESAKEKGKHIKPIYRKQGSQSSMSVEHSWSGSFAPIARFQQFRDRLEDLCGLPSRQELPRILDLAKTNALPSVWQRARLSPLEDRAIDIFSVLVFSSKERWPTLLQEFFQQFKWKVELSGRPTLDFRDENLGHVNRGLKIEEAVARLTPGCQVSLRARKKGGYASGGEKVAELLKTEGYTEQEVNAILESRSAQDAACRWFHGTQTDVHISLKSVRNDYSRFKRLKKRLLQERISPRS